MADMENVLKQLLDKQQSPTETAGNEDNKQLARIIQLLEINASIQREQLEYLAQIEKNSRE